MNKNTKLKLRSEKGSVQGEPLSASYLQDSSFSNDERASIERSNSVRAVYGGTTGLNYSGPTYFHGPMLPSHQYGNGQSLTYMLPHLETMQNTSEFPIFHRAVSFLQFKTIECSVKTFHEHKQCPLFHSTKDRRRCPQKYKYEPELCPEVAGGKVCHKYENCIYSHSTVELFYHPSKYKTKFCSGIVPGLKTGKCSYGTFCSFAHSESELRTKKLHMMEKTPEFFRFSYKTVYCPFSHQHDKSACEYAHNVQDYRRDPTVTTYSPETCRKWIGSAEISKYEDGGCNYNEACNKCHGWKELEYHPKFYKTKQCTHGEKCSRTDCGYLHPNEQVKQQDDLFSDRKLKQSAKESFTSASIRVKGKQTISQSQQSSSKDDRLLTFNSSSRSVLGKNDSLMVKKDENDRADLDSIVGEPKPVKLHARTELGNHEEDDSADGRPA
jgi:hypothetical protein